MEEKTVTLVMKIGGDGKVSINMDNRGFSIYEIHGILHEMITKDILRNIEELPEENKENVYVS